MSVLKRFALFLLVAILAASTLIFFAAQKTGNAGFRGSILSEVGKR